MRISLQPPTNSRLRRKGNLRMTLTSIESTKKWSPAANKGKKSGLRLEVKI